MFEIFMPDGSFVSFTSGTFWTGGGLGEGDG
jgi:hypothetical protein